ncbi:hypothetical protein HMPREF1574_01152 [Gardnerella pickettii JCP7659]|nr:hypothetical protein HMPREF1574_01152 [Gardnerella pickettii JCP7659]
MTFKSVCCLTLQYGILENGGAASRQSIRRRRSPRAFYRMILLRQVSAVAQLDFINSPRGGSHKRAHSRLRARDDCSVSLGALCPE